MVPGHTMNNRKLSHSRSRGLLVLGSSLQLLLGLVSCSGGPVSTTGGGVESASVSLTTTAVPADVKCIVLTAAATGSTVTRSFDVTPSQAATMTATGLPTGTVTLTEGAYNAACSQVTAQTPLTWVSDAPVVVQLAAGQSTPVTIVLRRPGGAVISTTFSDDAGVNNPPTIATVAFASPSTVTGSSTALSVLGADDGGEANLTYTWTTTGTPPASVSFSANGTNGAKNTTATFTAAGSYSFQVTVKDQGNLTAASAVGVTVNPTLTSIVVTPASATVLTSATQQFTATARNQFGTNMTPQPSFTWTVTGGGTVSTGGLFTAGTSTGGPYTIQAASGSLIGVATITVGSAPAPVAIYRINAGSSSAVSPFAADAYGSGGTQHTVTNTISTTGVTNAAPAAVYQSERYGNSTYTFPSLVASTQYTIRLHFAELYWTATGKRVFNVLINGTTVLSNFDVFAAAGAQYKAVVRDFTATPDASGQIVIKFNTVTDNATIGGIEVLTTSCSAGLQYCGSACVNAGASSPPTGITLSGTTPICSGTQTKLTVSGGSLGAGASWVWYTNSSHTGAIGTGASITVSPASTTTYFVRAEGPCSNTSDASQSVSVYPPPQVTVTPSSQAPDCTVAYIGWTTLYATLSSASAPPNSIQWYYTSAATSTKLLLTPKYVKNASDTTLNLTMSPQVTQTDWIQVIDVCGQEGWGSSDIILPDMCVCFEC